MQPGWNTIDVTDSGGYRWLDNLKLQGGVEGGCTFSEVEIIGVEVLDITDTLIDCYVDVHVGGVGEYKQ